MRDLWRLGDRLRADADKAVKNWLPCPPAFPAMTARTHPPSTLSNSDRGGDSSVVRAPDS